MRASSWLLVALVAAAGLLASIALLGGDRAGSALAEAPSAAVVRAAARAERDPSPAASVPREGGPRTGLAAPAAPDPASSDGGAAAIGGGLAVLVVRAGSREALAGAEVCHWVPSPTHPADREAAFELAWRDGTLEGLMRTEGALGTSDSLGRAAFPEARAEGFVVAQAAGLWGWARVEPGAPQPLRVEVRADWDLVVRVRDGAGRGAEGVRVGLRQSWDEWGFLHLLATTDAEGLATLRHAAGPVTKHFEIGTRWSVCLAEAFASPVAQGFDPERPPREAIELVLPEHGSCEVSVIGPGGQPAEDSFEIALQCRPRDRDPGELRDEDPWDWTSLPTAFAQADSEGRARFDVVGLGTDLAVAVRRPGSSALHRTDGSGPRRPGERVTIEVRLGVRAPILAGRLLDPDGQALADVPFRAQVEYRERSGWRAGWGHGTSDAAGRFVLDVPERHADVGPRLLRLQLQHADGRGLGTVERELPALLAPGVHELGDLILVPHVFLAAGQVVEADGSPVVGARVWASARREVPGRVNHYRVETLDTGSVRSDASGRFELYGRSMQGAILMQARLDERKSEQVEILPGARDVRLVLARTGEIAGRVLSDPSIPLRALGIQIVGSSGEHSGEILPLAEDGSFVIRGVMPGSYTVCLMRSDSWDRIECFEDVLVRGGEVTRDRRLDPLDLTASLRAYRLTVQDPEGQPIEWGGVLSLREGEDGVDVQWSELANGQALVLGMGPSIEVSVGSSGFLTERVMVDGDRTLVLRRSPTLRLVLAGGAQAPQEPVFLQASFSSGGGELLDHDWFTGETFFGADGVALVRPSRLGELELQLSLVRHGNNWSSAAIDDGISRTIQIRERGEQTVEVHLDPEALDKALAELDR